MRLKPLYLFSTSLTALLGPCAVSAARDRPAVTSIQPRRPAAPQTQQVSGTPTVIYRYDSLGRLIRDQRPTTTLTYTYDSAGNRVQSTVQH